MRILLLRHGQTPSNVRGLLDSAYPGAGLTDLGQQQAQAVPQALADREVGAVAVSPLIRTSLTAAPLLAERQLEATSYDGLREIQAADLEMASDRESLMRYMETVFAWSQGNLSHRMPGGANGEEFFAGFDGAIESLAETGHESLVAVSHGAAIRTWAVSRVAGLEQAHIEQHTLANTGAVDIEGDPDSGWRLVRWTQYPIGGQSLDAPSAYDPTGEA